MLPFTPDGLGLGLACGLRVTCSWCKCLEAQAFQARIGHGFCLCTTWHLWPRSRAAICSRISRGTCSQWAFEGGRAYAGPAPHRYLGNWCLCQSGIESCALSPKECPLLSLEASSGCCCQRAVPNELGLFKVPTLEASLASTLAVAMEDFFLAACWFSSKKAVVCLDPDAQQMLEAEGFSAATQLHDVGLGMTHSMTAL